MVFSPCEVVSQKYLIKGKVIIREYVTYQPIVRLHGSESA